MKGEVGNREISCHLQLGIGLLGMGREITSQKAWPKSISNYDGHACVYNFTCGSLQSLINLLPEHLCDISVSMPFTYPLVSSDPCLFRYRMCRCKYVAVTARGIVVLSSTSIKARIKHTPRPAQACSPATEGAWSPESCPVCSESLPAHQQRCKLMSCTNTAWSSRCYSLEVL